MKFDLDKEIDRNQYKNRVKYLLDKRDKVELKSIRGIRTLRQNSYLHICITLYAVEFGYTLNEAKTDLKRACDFMIYEKNGNKYLKETKKQTTEELTKISETRRYHV